MGKSSSIRVVLADDHPLLVAGFSMTLQGHGIEVVGDPKTPEEAINQFRALQPDVLVLDIRFGSGMTGLDAAKVVRSEFSQARIVFLSQFDADNLITEAYRVGGCAFITKDCDPAELATAIRKAKEGKTHFLPRIAERLAIIGIRGDRSPHSVLEPRELEIFKLMARGLTQAEIAEQMDLSLKTISTATQTIRDKLGVQRSADLTLLAVKHDLLTPDETG